MRNVIGAISPSEPYGVPFDAIAHNQQAIYSAANELFDAARTAQTMDAALRLARDVRTLRAQIDAVATRALERADELSGKD